jgi:hypothetical protein
MSAPAPEPSWAAIGLEQIPELADKAAMWSLRPLLFVSLALSACLPFARAEETVRTTVLSALESVSMPHLYNGLMYVRGALGSASMVSDGVFTTAAHVIFDEEELTWAPRSSTRLYPRYHQVVGLQPTGQAFTPVAYMRWTSYATRVENDNSGPGLSSPDTFNIDYAAGYLSRVDTDARLTAYPEVHVDQENAVSILREDRDKLISGYPADTDFIEPAQVGFMHATPPGNYFCWWGGLEDRPDTWRDSEDLWVATYEFEGVSTHSGNSGGPMYVRDDAGAWLLAGMVVGSIGSTSVLVRGVDEGAWQLIEAAIVARGTSGLRRAGMLSANTDPHGVWLEWQDRSPGEAGYRVLRMDAGEWRLLAELPADSESFLDESARPGSVHRYKVQPFDAAGRRSPASPEAHIRVPGVERGLGAAIGRSWLGLSSAGDSGWHVDGDGRLRAARVRPLGSTALRLDLIGPGVLNFEWSVSSEENPDYTNPQSPNRGEIYDAVFLHLNGEPVNAGDEPVFLSGSRGPEALSLEIPAGPQVVEWRYVKDPYSSEGEDTAFLHSLDWIPDADNPSVVHAAYADGDDNRQAAAWFGGYALDGDPWIRHDQLGWLLPRAGDGFALTAHSPVHGIGEFYTTPEIFPYLYLYRAGKWLMWVEDSGVDGHGLWFYDLAGERFFRAR